MLPAVSIFYSKDDDSAVAEFSSFSSAFFTLMCITTGGINWSQEYVLIYDDGRDVATVDPVRGVFFLTFDLAVIVTTFNIMLAVLLQGFVASMSEAEAAERIVGEARDHHKVGQGVG